MTTRRLFLQFTTILPALGAAPAASPTAAQGGAPRNYVLVAGAWHGGWMWRKVANLLRAAGHQVFAVTNTGLGERHHLLRNDVTFDVFIDDIVNVIEWEELRDVYLVGHSFSGRTVSAVADRIPERLKRIVFLDAVLSQNGESMLDTLPPAAREERVRSVREVDGVKVVPPPEPAALGVTAPEDAAWLKRRLTPHPLSTYTSPLRLAHPLGNSVPCTYIHCIDPISTAIGPSAAYAKSRADWQNLEIRSGHDAMVISPGPLSEMLLALA